MDYLTEQEVKAFKQDVQHGVAKQTAEKIMFEKRLLDGLGEEMEEELKNPTSKVVARQQNLARKLNNKKRRAIRRENFRKILGLKETRKGDQ